MPPTSLTVRDGRRRGVQRYQPPLTLTCWPAMKPASSEQRNPQAAATWGTPTRPTRVIFASVAMSIGCSAPRRDAARACFGGVPRRLPTPRAPAWASGLGFAGALGVVDEQPALGLVARGDAGRAGIAHDVDVLDADAGVPQPVDGVGLGQGVEEPGDTGDAAVVGHLAEVDALHDDVAVGVVQRPAEPEVAVVLVDAARHDDPVAGELLLEPGDVGDERLPPLGPAHRVGVHAVLVPRALKQPPPLRLVGSPRLAIRRDQLCQVHRCPPARRPATTLYRHPVKAGRECTGRRALARAPTPARARGRHDGE